MCRFLDSLVVRISACRVEGWGSIPGRGGKCFVCITIGPQLILAPPIMLSEAETSITVVYCLLSLTIV